MTDQQQQRIRAAQALLAAANHLMDPSPMWSTHNLKRAASELQGALEHLGLDCITPDDNYITVAKRIESALTPDP
tara:strand:- start:437 stop:661 length:225 start_codon:yes stop_codon:yes gene_type:complete